jgi:NAD(P)-dependent dehydrogenase (short-subunit alcohol dehydrogenase family)
MHFTNFRLLPQAVKGDLRIAPPLAHSLPCPLSFYTDHVTSAFPLAGQSAFVTGGSRRIGRVIALALAHAGADVAISYHASQAEAAQTAALIAALGRRSLAVQCDVRSEPSVHAAVAGVIAALGRLHILVNNAAIFASGALEGLTLDQWDAVFETNTRGPFLVAREALPHLRSGEGRIVNIGSLGGFRAWPGHAHYCASKAALHMLTQTMAKAFAPEVSVNCVAPGWIQFDDLPEPSASPVAAPGAPHPAPGEAERKAGSQSARFAAKTPMGRNGSPADVAQAVLFFATGPHFITGQILAVDGGLGIS